MVTERSNFMKEVKNYEWSSLLDLTGKGLNQFNAVDQNLNCSQLMNNANLDWNVEMKPVLNKSLELVIMLQEIQVSNLNMLLATIGINM